MSIRFDGEFPVPGTPQELMQRFTEVERMAGCMPGAAITGREDDGGYTGEMIVSFGPKKIRFKGKVYCDFDMEGCSGVLRSYGAADLRAARIEMTTGFTVRTVPDADPGQPVSLVALTCEAELGGVLADFARTGGNAVAEVLMRDFSHRLADELSRGGQDEVRQGAGSVSAGRLLWEVARNKIGYGR